MNYKQSVYSCLNLLNRENGQLTPNKSCATDIAYIPTAYRILYMYAVIILLERHVLGYRIDHA